MTRLSDKSDLTRGFEQARVDDKERKQFEDDARDAALAMSASAKRTDSVGDLRLVLDVLFGEDIALCGLEPPEVPEARERPASPKPKRRLA